MTPSTNETAPQAQEAPTATTGTVTEAPTGAAEPTPKSNEWYLSNSPVFRAVLHLSIPLAAALVVAAMQNLLNAGFLGAQNDLSLIAAVTFGTPILILFMAIGNVFGIGGGALVSRLLGERSSANTAGARNGASLGIRQASSFSVWGAAIVGLAITVIGLSLIHPLVQGLGARGEAAAPTTTFVSVMLMFLPVFAAAGALEQIVRAEGAARVAMTGLMINTVATLLLDVVFILVLHWGVAGVALSMGLSNILGIAYWALWIHRSKSPLSLSLRHFTLAPSTAGPVLTIGAGVLLQSMFMLITTLLLNTLAASYGNDPLAAMGVAVRIAQVPEFLIMGISMGVLPLLAYAFGRGDAARLRSATRMSLLLAVGLGVMFTLVFFALSGPLLGFFFDSTEMMALGASIIAAQLLAMIANAASGIVITLFQATGRALPSVIMSATQGVLFIPIAIGANIWLGLPGLVWSLAISEGMVAVAGFIMWRMSRGAINRGLAAAAAGASATSAAVEASPAGAAATAGQPA